MADPVPQALSVDSAPFVRVGCAGLPAGVARAAYFQRLDLLETDATFFEPPRESILRRWRKDAPAPSAFSALAWQLVTHDAGSPGYVRLGQPLPDGARGRVGAFRPTEEVAEAWRRSVAAARALEAEALVFQTPASFAPTEPNREALRRFFGDVVGPVKDLALVWEPRGVWEPPQAARLASELGLVLAVDPLQLEVPPPEGALAYFRIYGLGLYGNRISEDHLDLLAEMAAAYERSWIVFANVEKYRDAQRFRKLWLGREFVGDLDDEDEGDDDDGDGDGGDGDDDGGPGSDGDDGDTPTGRE